MKIEKFVSKEAVNYEEQDFKPQFNREYDRVISLLCDAEKVVNQELVNEDVNPTENQKRMEDVYISLKRRLENTINLMCINLEDSTLHISEQSAKNYTEETLAIILEIFVKENPDLESVFAECFSEDRKRVEIKKFAEVLKQKIGDLNQKQLFSFVKFHKERLDIENGELKKRFEEIKVDFISVIENAVKSGVLPESAADNLSRINDVTSVLRDTFEHYRTTNVLGSYGAGKVFIQSYMLKAENGDKLKHVLFHEFIHLISGTSVTNIENATQKTSIDRKLGLRLSDGKNKPRQTWLNEATTEMITCELTEDEQNGNYSNEREILGSLLEKGLDKELLLRAFFENFVKNEEQSQVGKNYAELMRQIQSIIGASEFSKIESDFNMKEVSRVLFEYGAYTMKGAPEEYLNKCKFKKKITVSIGSNDANIITKEFVFALPDELANIDSDNRFDEMTGEELGPLQWRLMKEKIGLLKDSFGSNRFKFKVDNL